jgi:uncharacterized protein YccT (UPF0319 family)
MQGVILELTQETHQIVVTLNPTIKFGNFKNVKLITLEATVHSFYFVTLNPPTLFCIL